MMVTVARAYVLLLFIISLVLLTTSLFLHMSVWIGESSRYRDGATIILVGALLFNFVVLCLAKERNVWKNEFMACPVWLRSIALLFACYGFGVAVMQTVLRSVGPSDLLTISAVPLVFEALSVSVLYSVLWRRSLEAKNLVHRAGISFGVVAAVLVLLLVNRLA